MKDVQCYELLGGIALKNHAFSFITRPFETVDDIFYQHGGGASRVLNRW